MASVAQKPEAVVAIDRVPWRLVRGYLHRNWKAGDHVSIFAPTGSGKTHLCLLGLHPLWDPDYPRLLIDVKGDDPTLEGVGRVVSILPDPHTRYRERGAPQIYRFVVPEEAGESKEAFAAAVDSLTEALKAARKERRWVIHLNEVRALADRERPAFGIRPYLEWLWLRGRPHITIVAETQRPAFVPGSMYDNATHYFFGQGMDEKYRERLAAMGGGSEAILDAIGRLREHEFVYWHRQTGRMAITKVR